MEKMGKAVLFDMDGVLVHSEPIIRKAAKAALSEWGVTARDEDFTDFIGAGEDRFVGGVAEKHGVPYELKMKERAYEIYETLVRDEIVVCAGVKETLAALRARGFQLALCSSADMVKVKMNLSAAEIPFETFDHIVGGDGVARKKPFPDVFLAASDALGVAPENCFVAEDAINGIAAAKAAGMKSVAVTTFFSREVLQKEAAPDYIADSVAEILDVAAADFI
jgi:cytidine deaminase